MMPATRIGVVGAGAIAQVAHLPALSKLRGVELVALCDNDGPKARALADRLGVEDVYTDIEDLLEDGNLDAVVVITPNHLHEPHALSAIAGSVVRLPVIVSFSSMTEDCGSVAASGALGCVS